MSISRMTVAVPCPNCGVKATYSLLSTIDARRDPQLRTAILDRTLQQKPCAACGTRVRPPPAFMYFDRRCNLWVSAHDWTKRAAWADWEQRARTNFQTICESGSSIGRQLQAGPVRARVTFGWEALREKIVAAEQGIDDVLLETCKYHVLRTGVVSRLETDDRDGVRSRNIGRLCMVTVTAQCRLRFRAGR